MSLPRILACVALSSAVSASCIPGTEGSSLEASTPLGGSSAVLATSPNGGGSQPTSGEGPSIAGANSAGGTTTTSTSSGGYSTGGGSQGGSAGAPSGSSAGGAGGKTVGGGALGGATLGSAGATQAAGGNSFVIQAEDFVSCVDKTSGNADLVYRMDVDADITFDHDPFYYEGIRVHNIETGESLTYTINVPRTDTWNITFNGLLNFDLYFDNQLYKSNAGVPIGYVATDFRTNQNMLVGGISLSAGSHTMKIVANNGVNDYNDMQLDYIWFASSTTPPAALPVPIKPYNDTVAPSRPTGYTSPVSRFGKLYVEGANMRSTNTGANARLRGIALHGAKWFPTIPKNTIYNLAYHENIQLVRLAMYAEWGTYDDPEMQDYLKAKTLEVINEAIDAGIYLEISYHTHITDVAIGSAAYNLELAFYKWLLAQPVVAAKPPNLLFGIINELASSTLTWGQAKPYAQDFVNLIRKTHPDNIITCGTPYWCQHPQDVIGNQLAGSNIVYTFHLYTGSHLLSLADNVVTCYNAGVPVWANEISPGTYDWKIWQYNFANFDSLVSTLESRGLGWTTWNFSLKGEALSALKWNSQFFGPWQTTDLSEGGVYLRTKLSSP